MIFLLINTCKNYFSNIYPLIDQINKSEFPKNNILIVSCQEDEGSNTYIDGIKLAKVTYSALHLSSCVYVYENINRFKKVDYWVLLPDTIKFGDLFFHKLNNYYNTYLRNNIIHCLPFIDPCIRPTMDMGIVHKQHIIQMGNYLMHIKLNYPYTREDLLNKKAELIYDENIIFGLIPNLVTPQNSRFVNFNVNPMRFITNNREDLI